MKKSVLTFAVTILMASTGFAIVGNKATLRQGGPAGVCRIFTRDENNRLHGICSATLVAPNKILTAQHCLDKDTDIYGELKFTVECGYEGVTKNELLIEHIGLNALVYTRGVQFKESANAFPFFKDRSRDNAIMILDKNLSSPPIKVMADTSYKDATNCAAAGYGDTNNSTAGILYQGVLGAAGYFKGGIAFRTTVLAKGIPQIDTEKTADPEEIAKKLLLSEKLFLTETMTQAILRPGDSGGPLLCENKAGEIFVAGVAAFTSLKEAVTSHPVKGLSGVVSFNPISAYYTVRPTTITAIEQDIAPREDGGEYISHDVYFPSKK